MTQITNIKIKNFRQFKSLNLNFDESSGIYLFIGRNGVGKSNFMNAICWCLYGTTPFDSKKEDAPKMLLNEEARIENSKSEIFVSITFKSDNTIYAISRSKREEDQHTGKISVVKLNEGDSETEENPTYIINQYFPEELNSLFIFDGEGIEKLFYGEYSTNLKKSIEKVADIELIDNSMGHLETIKTEIQRDIAKTTPKLKILIEQKDDLRNEINNNNNKIETLNSSIEELTEKHKEMSTEIDKNKEARQLAEEKVMLRDQINSINKEINRLKSINTQIASEIAPYIVLYKEIKPLIKFINEQEGLGQIPPWVASTLISELIEQDKCICDRHLTPEITKKFKKIREESVSAEEKGFLLGLKTVIDNQRREEVFKVYKRLKQERAKMSQLQEENSRREVRLREVEEKLDKYSENDAEGDPEQLLSVIESKIEELKRERTLLEGKVEESVTLLKKIEEEIRIITDKEHLYEKEKRKMSLIEIVIGEFSNIRTELVEAVRKKVSEEVNDFFKNLTWKINEVEYIEFTEDYKVKVKFKGSDENVLDNLSTGEKKILGISTIKALSDLSGFKEVPSFIDSPLEQLSEDVSANLLENIGALAKDKQLFIFSLDDPKIIDYSKEKLRDRTFVIKSEDPTGDYFPSSNIIKT